MSELDDAERSLRAGGVADVGNLLKPAGVRELEQEIARLGARGLRAHVVIAPRGATLAPWHELWTRQGYEARHDLLLLFNGERWEARGWGLSAPAVDAALANAEAALHQYYGRGLTAALANLAHATAGPTKEPTKQPATSAVPIVALGAGALGAAALGWVLVRRARRSKERRAQLTAARASADEVFAEVLLATEVMAETDAAPLRDKATRLREQIDAIAPRDLKQLPPRQEDLTLARLGQMENELEALRSRVLQVKRRS